MQAEEVVVNILALRGDSLAYQTRFHREVFLLDRGCSADLGLPFSYDKAQGCPYSYELVDGWIDARAHNRIELYEEKGLYGVPHLVFRLLPGGKDYETSLDVGVLKASDARPVLARLAQAPSTVLAIAADIAYWEYEEKYCQDAALAELKIRKPFTTQNHEMIEQALALLAFLKNPR